MFECIEAFYKRIRRHNALHYLSPDPYEGRIVRAWPLRPDEARPSTKPGQLHRLF